MFLVELIAEVLATLFGHSVADGVERRRHSRLSTAVAPLLAGEEVRSIQQGSTGPPLAVALPLYVLLLVLWRPVGVLLTERRLVLTRHAPFTKTLRRVQVDVPHELVSARLSPFGTTLRLRFDPIVGHPPVRLVFMRGASLLAERLSTTAPAASP